MKPVKFLIAGMSLFFPLAAQAAEVHTNPVGSYVIECLSNSDTIVSIPLTRPPVYEGDVAAVSGNTIVIKGSPGWDAGSLAYAQGSQPDHYYIVFTNGPNEGAWFDIDSNTSSSVTVAGPLDGFDAGIIGSTVQIIPHWTLNTIMPGGEGTHPTNRPAPITSVYLYSTDSVGINIKPSMQFFYVDAGEGSEHTHWSQLGAVSGGNFINQNDVVVRPDSFMIIRNPANAAPTVLHLSGSVKMFNSEIRVGTLQENTYQDNFIAAPSCLDVTLGELTSALVDSGLMRVARGAQDTLMVYDLDGAKTNRKASTYYYYYDSANTAYNGWYALGSNAPSSGVVIKRNSAFFVRKLPTAEAEVNSAPFTPAYLK